ncbi:hypothetical protein Moror_5945 [Moniliophthora roreri MCA 2997]|uniref:Uncharacterized protein n=2 Tax=Moniliophthora roreri TaxID=221103 RepID=V2WXV0_MONRO|nr:hypothetical protein Moror_5945 [Moniliophthora roreri MCA 2997]KAI3614436.1 hypothetical protein WG66_009769 [Moniliophthora roreri]
MASTGKVHTLADIVGSPERTMKSLDERRRPDWGEETTSGQEAKAEGKNNQSPYYHNENRKGTQNNNNGGGNQSNGVQLPSRIEFIIGISIMFLLVYIYKHF